MFGIFNMQTNIETWPHTGDGRTLQESLHWKWTLGTLTPFLMGDLNLWQYYAWLFGPRLYQLSCVTCLAPSFPLSSFALFLDEFTVIVRWLDYSCWSYWSDHCSGWRDVRILELTHCCWLLLCSIILCSQADLLHSYVILHKWLDFYSAFFEYPLKWCTYSHAKLIAQKLCASRTGFSSPSLKEYGNRTGGVSSCYVYWAQEVWNYNQAYRNWHWTPHIMPEFGHVGILEINQLQDSQNLQTSFEQSSGCQSCGMLQNWFFSRGIVNSTSALVTASSDEGICFGQIAGVDPQLQGGVDTALPGVGGFIRVPGHAPQFAAPAAARLPVWLFAPCVAKVSTIRLHIELDQNWCWGQERKGRVGVVRACV